MRLQRESERHDVDGGHETVATPLHSLGTKRTFHAVETVVFSYFFPGKSKLFRIDFLFICFARRPLLPMWFSLRGSTSLLDGLTF